MEFIIAGLILLWISKREQNRESSINKEDILEEEDFLEKRISQNNENHFSRYISRAAMKRKFY